MRHLDPILFTPEDLTHSLGGMSLSAPQLTRCRILWSQWLPHLQQKILGPERSRVLALWLAEYVEDAVDAAWELSPSDGFLLNTLAATLCMAAVRTHIPEIAAAACAPFPRPTPELVTALSAAGLPCSGESTLETGRRYAVVTPYPFRGACTVCALATRCKGAQGQHSQTAPPTATNPNTALP